MTLITTEPTLTVDELKTIVAPTLVMVGDDDMIKLSHTSALFEALPHGQLAIVPATSHALPVERPTETAQIIFGFLRSDSKPVTFMPIRRKHPQV